MSKQASLTKTSEKNGSSFVSAKPKKNTNQTMNSPVGQMLHLQQTLGNQAVQRLLKSGKIQAKLKIGKPNDKYEQEADRVADKVMSMPEGALAPAPASSPNPKRQEETLPNHWMQKQPDEEEELKAKPLAEQITPLVQRQVGPEEEEEPVQGKLLQRQETEEEEEPVQTKLQRQAEDEEEEDQTELQRQPEEEEDKIQRQTQENEEDEEEEIPGKFENSPNLQRQEDIPEENKEEEEKLQTKEVPGQTPAVTPNLTSRINSLRGGGQSLPKSIRNYFEPRFGTDFSQVRLHTDSKAAETAKSINAKAFTKGKDVVFGSGQYSPETSTGKRLLAHELTHVVQQTNKSKFINKVPSSPRPRTSSNVNRIVSEAFVRYNNKFIKKSYSSKIPWVFCPDPRHKYWIPKHCILQAALRPHHKFHCNTGKGSSFRIWGSTKKKMLRIRSMRSLGSNLNNFPPNEGVTFLGSNVWTCHLYVFHVLYKAGLKPPIPSGYYYHPSKFHTLVGSYFNKISSRYIQPGDICADSTHSEIVTSCNIRGHFKKIGAGKNGVGIEKGSGSVSGWTFYRVK